MRYNPFADLRVRGSHKKRTLQSRIRRLQRGGVKRARNNSRRKKTAKQPTE